MADYREECEHLRWKMEERAKEIEGLEHTISVFERGIDCLINKKDVTTEIAHCASPDIFENFMTLKKRDRVCKEIIFELHKALETLGAKSDLLCITGSFRDTITDEEILTNLIVWNGACIQCKGLNDSRELLDICESCEMQNKMDKLKREDGG